MACPVHGGDNKSAVNVFTEGSTSIGNWKCWTNSCEQVHGFGIMGFIHGILTSQGKSGSFKESAKWAYNFIKSAPKHDIKIKAKQVKEDSPQEPIFKNRIEFRSSVNIPAKYYIGRNYKPQTLNKFDVGMCFDKKNRHFMRVVVPVYDEFGYTIIGTMARSINPKCPKCEKYHMASKPCPSNDLEKFWSEKWLHSKGFRKSKSLYNLWNAKESIKATKTAVLVEGPGDVWRLDEAGIHNVVGIYGVEFNQFQSDLLEKLGVMNLVLITDNDKAGEEAVQKIRKKYRRNYNIRHISVPLKDVGEMSIEQINEFITPELEKVYKYE